MSVRKELRDGTHQRLDRRTLLVAVKKLTARDSGLRRVVHHHGPPPLWARRPGFSTLIRIVLEQQVSLASAKAIYHRLEGTLGSVSPATILGCGQTGLRRLGITRQKAAYCTEIARSLRSGELNLRRVSRASDHGASEELMRVKGIGPWTADIYMLMALRRPDVWPAGDSALLTALKNLMRRSDRPSVEEAACHAHRWAPWRSVAARILWHGYLAGMLR